MDSRMSYSTFKMAICNMHSHGLGNRLYVSDLAAANMTKTQFPLGNLKGKVGDALMSTMLFVAVKC